MTLPAYTPRRPPFAHQYAALEAGWEHPGFGYFLEMGLGKSRVAVDNFCMLYRAGLVHALLVVAPKGVYSNWSRQDVANPGELQSWLWEPEASKALVYTWQSGKSKRETGAHAALLNAAPGVRVLVVNVEALSVQSSGAASLCERFLRAHNTMIVVDESTIMKSAGAARTRTLTKLGRLAKYRRILTGTPITGSPSDVFPQFQFLQPGSLGYTSFVVFRERYCVLKEMYVGGRTIKTEAGVRNLDELAERMKQHSYRARKVDCLDLPPKVYERRDIDLTPEQSEMYKAMRREAMVAMEDGREMTTQIVMTQMMRLHQIACGHVKWDSGESQRIPNNREAELLDVLEAAPDEKAIVWCSYRSDADAVARMLRDRFGREAVVEWHGGISVPTREAGEGAFQTGTARYMVASQQAAGRGRTWTAATLVVYYSNSHSLEDRLQSEDRAHRIGQTGTVTIVDIVARGTVDEKIVKSLRANLDVVRAALQDGPSTWI